MGARAKYARIRSIAPDAELCRTVGGDGLEQLVVVRALPPAALGDAQRAAAAPHPNLARLVEVSDDAADPFVAREYLHGESFEQVAAAAHDNGVPIALPAALALAGAACAAVAHAHARDLVHGAIAPACVLVGYDGSVKLLELATPPVSGATRAGDLRAIARLIAEHALGAPALEAIVARAAADGFADAGALRAALAGYAAEAQLAVGPPALARLMEALYPGRREEWAKARKQGAFFVEALVLQVLDAGATSPGARPAAPEADDEPTGVTDVVVRALPASEITNTKTDTATHVGVHLAPIAIDLEAGSGGLIAPPPPAAPGAVPIVAAFAAPPSGALVTPSVLPAPGEDAAPPAKILSPAMPNERTERLRIPTPVGTRPRDVEPPRRARSRAVALVVLAGLAAALAGGVGVFAVLRSRAAPAAVADAPADARPIDSPVRDFAQPRAEAPQAARSPQPPPTPAPKQRGKARLGDRKPGK